MKKWTQQEEEFLTSSRPEKTYAYIAEVLGRSVKSVERKGYRLGLTKYKHNPEFSFKSLSKELCIELVKKHKSSDYFNQDKSIPGHKTIMKVLGANTWSEARKIAGVPFTTSARFCPSKPTYFYIIEITDDSGILFRKFGVTQRTLSQRMKNLKIPYTTLVYKKTLNLKQALRIEKLFSNITKKYSPKSKYLYADYAGGHTECYVP